MDNQTEMENSRFVSEACVGPNNTKVYHIDDGFYYYFHLYCGQRLNLRCVNSNRKTPCPARMSIPMDVSQRTVKNARPGVRPHNHLPTREWIVEQCARHKCIQRSVEEETDYRKIYNEVTSELPESIIENLPFQSLCQAMYRARKRANSDIPPKEPRKRQKKKSQGLSSCETFSEVEGSSETLDEESSDQPPPQESYSETPDTKSINETPPQENALETSDKESTAQHLIQPQPLMESQRFISEAFIRDNSKVYHIDDGFYYYFHTSTKDLIWLRCVYHHKTRCLTRMTIPKDETKRTIDSAKPTTRPHNHPPIRDWFVKEVARYRCVQKYLAEDAKTMEVCCKEETSALPVTITRDLNLPAVKQAMYRAKKRAQTETLEQREQRLAKKRRTKKRAEPLVCPCYSCEVVMGEEAVEEQSRQLVDSEDKDTKNVLSVKEEIIMDPVDEKERISSYIEEDNHLTSTSNGTENSSGREHWPLFNVKTELAETSADETQQQSPSEVDGNLEDKRDVKPFPFIDCGDQYTYDSY